MSTFASSPFASIVLRRPAGPPLWARVTTALASVVVSLTLFGAVSIGLTEPSFDLAAVAADTGRYLDPIVVAAHTSADD
ncbi:MAG TPA: hypothetical protein VML58_04025 [Burkholderiaceae bacterium]|nr:hypothetical protein [Burkholderiaceae bacterium]